MSFYQSRVPSFLEFDHRRFRYNLQEINRLFNEVDFRGVTNALFAHTEILIKLLITQKIFIHKKIHTMIITFGLSDCSNLKNKQVNQFIIEESLSVLLLKNSNSMLIKLLFRRGKNFWIKRLRKATQKKLVHEMADDRTNPSYQTSELLMFGGDGDDSIVNHLPTCAVRILWEAVESKGASVNSSTTSTCVMVPKDLTPLQPHVLSCLIWRWPALLDGEFIELKQIPNCMSKVKDSQVCCNPYHWMKICKEYDDWTNTADTHLEDFSSEIQESYKPSTTEEYDVNRRTWCKIAYWEFNHRVGREHLVQKSFVNVYWSADDSENSHCNHGRLNLKVHTQDVKTALAMEEYREKVGVGISISLEEDGLWIYNRSDDSSVFVNPSSTECHGPIFRIPAGHCIRIYSYNEYLNSPPTRLSFIKGWGAGYHRQQISDCPNWIEIIPLTLENDDYYDDEGYNDY